MVVPNSEVTVKYCDVVDVILYGNLDVSYLPIISEYFYFKIRTSDGKEILLTSYFLNSNNFKDEYFEDLFLRKIELKKKFKFYPIILSVFRK